MKLDKKDSKFFIEKGDPGFNPDYNKKVVEDTIKEHDLNIKKKRSEYVDQVGERTHAVASYLTSRAIDSGKPIEQYVSRRYLTHLRGKSIVNRIKGNINPADVFKHGVDVSATKK